MHNEIEEKLWPKVGSAMARACVDANKPRKKGRNPLIEAGTPLEPPPPPPARARPVASAQPRAIPPTRGGRAPSRWPSSPSSRVLRGPAGTLVVACLLAVGGCGTGESGPSVSGVLFGEAFVARYAAFDTVAYDSILIDISDSGGICTAGSPPSDLRFVGLCLCTPGHDWVGDYSLAPGGGCPSPGPRTSRGRGERGSSPAAAMAKASTRTGGPCRSRHFPSSAPRGTCRRFRRRDRGRSVHRLFLRRFE